MDETVVMRRTIEAGPDVVWASVRGIGGLDRWFPVIASCRVDGAGVGALRVLGLEGGGELHDVVEDIDDGARLFRYRRVVHPFPVTRYVGTVEVGDGAGGAADVVWTLDIDVDPAARDELVPFLHKAVSDGLAGLARELEA